MSTQNLGPQTFVPQFYHKSNMIDYVSGGKKKVINLYTKMTDIGKHNLFIFLVNGRYYKTKNSKT